MDDLSTGRARLLTPCIGEKTLSLSLSLYTYTHTQSRILASDDRSAGVTQE